ncbi:MAG: hypothetical protein RL491_1321 [Bacteroidota bacterium]
MSIFQLQSLNKLHVDFDIYPFSFFLCFPVKTKKTKPNNIQQHDESY